MTYAEENEGVAIPSKPGQRLQFMVQGSEGDYPGLSQSLPNQVNDFNEITARPQLARKNMSQSLPNQVNDFNKVLVLDSAFAKKVAIPSKPGQRLQ